MSYKKISIIGMLTALALSSFGGWTNRPTSGNWSTNGLKDDGTKTTITFTNWNDGFVLATGCDTVTVKNFIFKYDPVPFCGGPITDQSGNRITFTPLSGMNTNAANLIAMDNGSFHNVHGTLIRDTLHNYTVISASNIPGGKIECTVAGTLPSGMAAATNYMFIYARTTTGIGDFRRCKKVILEDITFQGNPSIAFKGTDNKEIQVKRVNTDPVNGFMTSGRDAFNFGDIPKATFTGCTLTGIGDDCINLHSTGRTITNQAGHTIFLDATLPTLWTNNQTCIIVSLSDNILKFSGVISNINPGEKAITFTSNITADVTDCIVYNDRMCGFGGLVITNNKFQMGRRNALYMTPVCPPDTPGNISGNTFLNIGLCAFITPHNGDLQGYRSAYVNFKNNTLDNVALADSPNDNFVTISLLKGSGWRGIGHVNVNTNGFVNIGTRTGIYISDAQGCNLVGNTHPTMDVKIVQVNTTNIVTQ